VDELAVGDGGLHRGFLDRFAHGGVVKAGVGDLRGLLLVEHGGHHGHQDVALLLIVLIFVLVE